MLGPDSDENGEVLTDQFQSVFASDSDQGPAGHSERITPPKYVSADSGDADRAASLRDALDVLSRPDCLDNEGIGQFVGYFMSLYSKTPGKKEFRHMYSDVSDVMYSHFTEEGLTAGDVPDAIIYLENNMREIVNRFRSMYPDSDELQCVKKLQDHISLEKIRIQNQAKRNIGYLAKMESLSNEVHEAQDELDEKVTKATDKTKWAIEEIEKSKRDSVAILGILAAVVLAFNGGITFSVSGVNAVSGYHPIYVAFVVSMVGFVLFNSLAALFTFLRASVIERKAEEGKRCAIWGTGPLIAFVIADVALVLFVCKLFRIVYESYLF